MSFDRTCRAEARVAAAVGMTPRSIAARVRTWRLGWQISWWSRIACLSTGTSTPTGRPRGAPRPAAWSRRLSRSCSARAARGSAGTAPPTSGSGPSSMTASGSCRCGCPTKRSSSTTRASATGPSGRCTTMSSLPRSSTASGGTPTSRVNQRFAKAAARVAKRKATVWVQDYQLQLVPAMLRELRPDLRIGFFLHIPFPPTELFQQLPWRRQILEGLIGADLVGFQTPRRRGQNFTRLVRETGSVTRPRATRSPCLTGGRSSPGPSPSRSTPTPSRRLRRSPTSRPAQKSCARAWATQRPSCSASTGWTTPRACVCASAPLAS